ncbi:hypothetical protein OESDEN_24004 [Oesophagostomum dentatum]|uniref:Uncharacterized protein n=1 Tax=Oesophagostomum dentatum TaxID=61180 RepID=A0A0B1RXL1_OESDE|nr:hypothetical protein OESDEN_24004 [Oesophagostomum dentatum]
MEWMVAHELVVGLQCAYLQATFRLSTLLRISTVLILHAGINRRVECGSTVGSTTLESPKGELPKGSPTNIILSFDDPSTVTVYFKQPKEESIEIRECKVRILEPIIVKHCNTNHFKNCSTL